MMACSVRTALVAAAISERLGGFRGTCLAGVSPSHDLSARRCGRHGPRASETIGCGSGPSCWRLALGKLDGRQRLGVRPFSLQRQDRVFRLFADLGDESERLESPPLGGLQEQHLHYRRVCLVSWRWAFGVFARQPGRAALAESTVAIRRSGRRQRGAAACRLRQAEVAELRRLRGVADLVVTGWLPARRDEARRAPRHQCESRRSPSIDQLWGCCSLLRHAPGLDPGRIQNRICAHGASACPVAVLGAA
jgi:hypothetical protein